MSDDSRSIPHELPLPGDSPLLSSELAGPSSLLTTPLMPELSPLPSLPSSGTEVAVLHLMEKRMQQLEDRIIRQERELQSLRVARPAVSVSVEEGARGVYSGEVVRPPELQFTLDDLLRVVINYNASDLHIKANAPPTVRLNGELVPIGDRPLTEQESLYLVMSSIPKEKRAKLNTIREIDAAYVSRGVRFRLNAFLERGRVSASSRCSGGPCSAPGGLIEQDRKPIPGRTNETRYGDCRTSASSGSHPISPNASAWPHDT